VEEDAGKEEEEGREESSGQEDRRKEEDWRQEEEEALSAISRSQLISQRGSPRWGPLRVSRNHGRVSAPYRSTAL